MTTLICYISCEQETDAACGTTHPEPTIAAVTDILARDLDGIVVERAVIGCSSPGSS